MPNLTITAAVSTVDALMLSAIATDVVIEAADRGRSAATFRGFRLWALRLAASQKCTPGALVVLDLMTPDGEQQRAVFEVDPFAGVDFASARCRVTA